MIQAPPQPIDRPALARFIWERMLSLADAGDELGSSYEQVRRICLPFGHEDRRVPNADLMERIVAWTGGEVRPRDFYPAHLTEVTSPAAELVDVVAGGGDVGGDALQTPGNSLHRRPA